MLRGTVPATATAWYGNNESSTAATPCCTNFPYFVHLRRQESKNACRAYREHALYSPNLRGSRVVMPPTRHAHDCPGIQFGEEHEAQQDAHLPRHKPQPHRQSGTAPNVPDLVGKGGGV